MSVLGNYKKKPECIFSIREEMEKGTIDGDYIYAVLDGSLFMKTAHACSYLHFHQELHQQVHQQIEAVSCLCQVHLLQYHQGSEEAE